MAAISTPGSASVARPVFWAGAWMATYLGARLMLENPDLPAWLRVAAAMTPTPVAAIALLAIIRGARQLDELERRIQIEALATAFVLAVLLLMTLGLMELAVALNRDDWSYRHVWAMLPIFYFIGLTLARRRYA